MIWEKGLMAAGIPESDVHGGPEMLFQLLPSLWVCHPLFRRTAACISCCGRRGRLLFFHVVWYPLQANAAQSAETATDRGHSNKKCEWPEATGGQNEMVFIVALSSLVLLLSVTFETLGLHYHYVLNQNEICFTLAFHFTHLWDKNDLKLLCFASEELHLNVHRPLHFVTLLHSVLSFLSDRLNHLCYSEMLQAIRQDGACTKEPNMVWKSKTGSETEGSVLM